MKRRRTPAATNICAAIAIEALVGWVLQTKRIVHAVIRAIQKPNIKPDMRNFFPLSY
jgi:hypothetical protein